MRLKITNFKLNKLTYEGIKNETADALSEVGEDELKMVDDVQINNHIFLRKDKEGAMVSSDATFLTKGNQLEKIEAIEEIHVSLEVFSFFDFSDKNEKAVVKKSSEGDIEKMIEPYLLTVTQTYITNLVNDLTLHNRFNLAPQKVMSVEVKNGFLT